MRKWRSGVGNPRYEGATQNSYMERTPVIRRGWLGLAVPIGAVLLALGVVGVPQTTAQKNKETVIPVTTTIHDENSAPNDVLLRSDDYNGNGQWQATYYNTYRIDITNP